MAAAVLLYLFYIGVSPSYHFFYKGEQAFGQPCQVVFDAGRDLRVHLSCYEAVGFQAAQGYGQHLLGNIADGVAQLVKTEFAAVAEEDDDEDGPFVAEAVEDLADRAVDRVEWGFEGWGGGWGSGDRVTDELGGRGWVAGDRGSWGWVTDELGSWGWVIGGGGG